jgi:hypothetical protein
MKKPSSTTVMDTAAPEAAAMECYSACNFDPHMRGIGVQN